MSHSAYSAAGTARREVDLERMRAKWRREKKTVRRSGGQATLLLLSDLARACRVATKLTDNNALRAHLELAATYFDEADG